MGLPTVGLPTYNIRILYVGKPMSHVPRKSHVNPTYILRGTKVCAQWGAFLSDPSTIELDINISPGLITLSNRKIDIPIGKALLDIWLSTIPSPNFVGEGDIAFGLSVRLSVRPSHPRGVVLCALLLQMDKAVDFKTYADILLTYCSCAPRIQFVRKSFYLVKIEVKT